MCQSLFSLDTFSTQHVLLKIINFFFYCYLYTASVLTIFPKHRISMVNTNSVSILFQQNSYYEENYRFIGQSRHYFNTAHILKRTFYSLVSLDTFSIQHVLSRIITVFLLFISVYSFSLGKFPKTSYFNEN